LRERYHEFEQRNTAVVAVSSTDLEMTSYVAERLRAPFVVVSDAEWSVFYEYGVGSLLGVPMPGVFILDAQGIVRWRWVAPLTTVYDPPPLEDLLEVLDRL
jgi:peroxiredoxin